MNEKSAETSYRVGKNNFQRFGLDINAPVFITASFSDRLKHEAKAIVETE